MKYLTYVRLMVPNSTVNPLSFSMPIVTQLFPRCATDTYRIDVAVLNGSKM